MPWITEEEARATGSSSSDEEEERQEWVGECTMEGEERGLD